MPELMSQGLDLALYGMGTVFFFLTLLVFATMAMSALLSSAEVHQIERENGSEQDARIFAVITAAIQRYREGR